MQVEVFAGLSTFLALSYIFIVNPAILSQAGMDRSVVLFATIVAAASGTLLMGLWARLPFVVAPGMEINAYVAFFVVGALGHTWQQALGAVFWSGALFVLFTITSIREKIIEAIPARMKTALSLCVGVFLGLVALKVAGVLIYRGVTLHNFGSLRTPSALALYISLGLILILDKLKVRGAVLLSMVATALLCPLIGVTFNSEKAAAVTSAMFGGIGQLKVSVILDVHLWSVILILFLIDFYGSIAKFIGLTRNTSLMKDGELPGIREGLLIDGIATMVGSTAGTSSIVTYVESGVGIGIGGRTGLTAVVCSLLMFSCFLIAPLLKFVPVVATTGALVFVGIKLCPTRQELKDYQRSDVVVLIIMQVLVVLTFAIDRAMLVGFLLYIGRDLLARRKPNAYLVGSAALLLIGTILQLS